MNNKPEIFLIKDSNPDRKAMRSILREVIEDSKEYERSERQQKVFIKTAVITAGFLVLMVLLIGLARADNKIVITAQRPIDLSLIAIIESGGHPDAYNSHSGAVGMYQITPICLKDYNNFHKPQRTMAQMYDRLISKNVANWYLNNRIPSLLESYGLKDSTKNRLWAYNAGIGNVKKGRMPKETRDYIKKYEQLRKGVK